MFLCFSICCSYCFLRIFVCMGRQSLLYLDVLFLSGVHLLFTNPIPLMAASSLQSLTAGTVPLGSMHWTPVCVSPGLLSLSVISPMGYILLGCCRVLPSACLFSSSLEFIHECAFFFSMGIHTIVLLLYFCCFCICRKSFHNFLRF